MHAQQGYCDIHVESLVSLLALRSLELEEHTRRVTALAVELARAWGVPKAEEEVIRRGALLHDIGKIGLPDAILLKDSKLSKEEYTIVQKHPVHAYELLAHISYLKPSLSIPYYHHEKWDGSGYPHRLKGLQIPFHARLFAVVDVWDALLSDRPYRSAWTERQANEYILSQSGTHFQPEIVDVFLDKLLQYQYPKSTQIS